MVKDITELMKPRYKVVADYPGSHMYFDIGDILEWDGHYYKRKKNISMTKDTVESYPHLFKPLQWWEERKPEEMPEYVWYNDTPMGAKKKKLIVMKIDEWILEPDGEIWARINGDSIGFSTLNMPKPATESEYQSYLTTVTKT